MTGPAARPPGATARRLRAWHRWVLVLGLLALATGVALWPRDEAAVDPVAAPAVTRPAPDLAALRSEAALAPCPAPHPDSSHDPSGPLAGLLLPCLGAEGVVDLGRALAGRPALLNVWGSWCAPCRSELPALQAYAELPDAVELVGVNVEDTEAAALSLLAALGVRFPSVTDPEGRLRTALQVPPALPASYVVFPDGRAQRIVPPVVFTDAEQVRLVVRRYLGVGG